MARGRNGIRGQEPRRREGISSGGQADQDRKSSSQHSFFVYSLEHLAGGEYTPSSSTWQKEERASVYEVLFKLSSMTWAQINQASRKGLGFEKIKGGFDAIRAKVPDHVPKDAKPIAFRFGERGRMIGYRQNRFFYIVWLDRNHTAYDG